MGILFWMLLRSMLFSVIGNTFYKWFAGTSWGIWFDAKMKSVLNKVTHKEEQAQLKKPLKVKPEK
tara:strand:+ start:54 stop:248 length:195 start_codon:yes stop_codon:yes gene_type:complete